MIIKIGTFSSFIDFTINNLNVLEIEDKKLYANVVTSFYNHINDYPAKETLILLKDNALTSIQKNMFMIMDIYSFDFSIRKINNKLLSLLEDNIINNEMLKFNIENKIHELIDLIPEITNNFALDLIWENEIKLQKLLGLFSIKIDNDFEDSYFQRTLRIIDIVSELQLCEILVLCNLKTYLDTDELKELYKYIKYKEQKTLILESIIDENILYHERKVIIDYYFNDFIIE